MRFLIFIFLLCPISFAISAEKEFDSFNSNFNQGEFTQGIAELEKIKVTPKNKGKISFLKGLSFARINEFDKAKELFKESLALKYKTKEIFYEYGQVLYAIEDYKRARIAFKKSVQEKFKIGVSLYYIAYISQELKDNKKAVSFYNLIEKLPRKEKEDVIQAARAQIGDIYLTQIERLPDSFRAVEKYVIPQYKKAIEWDDKSSLASDIRDKIEKLKRKYELELFRMRNGRPTARPPYFLKANLLYGNDSNVTEANDKSDAKASPYYTAGFFGRYSIYPNSAFSLSPELNFNYTRYMSDDEEVYAEDNYTITGSLKINYEHLYQNLPATFYIDLSYTYGADDEDRDKTLAERDTEIGITFSEEVQLWANNPSTFRYGYSQIEAVESTNNFTTHNFTLEQVIALRSTTLFFYTSYDLNRYNDQESADNNGLTIRGDLIFSTVFGLFNPSLYSSLTNTDYIENSSKGQTSATTYGLSLNRPVGDKWYLTFDYSVTSQTGKLDTDEYDKQSYSLNLDYIY